MQRSAFFCKRTKRSHVLLHSLQKNEMFSAFFYVLCKITLRSFTFFYVRKKRTQKNASFFGSHKSPKTRKKNVKECCFLLKNYAFRKERNAVTNPANP